MIGVREEEVKGWVDAETDVGGGAAEGMSN